jgi:hypothetical protein
LMAEALTAAQERPTAPTPEGIITQQNALMPEALQEAARKKRMEEAQTRMQESKSAFEASRPGGLDQLIKVFGQAGQYKGLSGLAPAYTQNRERLAAEEAAFRREQEAARAKAEEQDLSMAKQIFDARAKDFAGQNEGFRKQMASRTEALSQLAGADQRSIDAALGRLSDMQIAKMRIASDAANASRPGAGERVTAQVLKLRSEGKNDEADALINTYTKITQGSSGNAGAENAVTRARRQEMQELQNIMKDEGMVFSEETKAWAAQQYETLAKQNASERGDGVSNIPAPAIDALKKNPSLADQFDQKYGKGASAKYLQK